MPENSPSISERIDRARQGNRQELEWLLSRQSAQLMLSALKELSSTESQEEDAARLVELTLGEAESHFAGFSGSTQAEISQWISQILKRIITSHLNQTSLRPSSDSEETLPPIFSEATLSRPIRPPTEYASEETLPPPTDDATLARPDQLQKTPATDTGDIHTDATINPPAGKTAPEKSPPNKSEKKQNISQLLADSSFGDYEMLEMIARGGMGVVFKARQRKLNRIVAVKMILAGRLADEMDVERFYAEAEAAANLRHRNIVAIYEVGEHEGQHFFSMDYIAGKSLAELVRGNPLSPRRAADYVKTISETVQYAHERGILHRDLKPANILLDAEDEPLITDFGLAKKVEGESQLTMTGAIVGTPSYMPPEQASADSEAVGPASDIYSTGAILYELVTGRPPFRAATPFETVRQVLESDPVSPRIINPNVPVDLETICNKCLEKEPTARYESAQDLADELGRYLAGEPILARPISPAARGWRWCKRNPLIAGLSGSALAFLILALVASIVGYVKTSDALEQTIIAKNQSDKSLQQARQAVNDMFTQVSEEALLNQPGMQELRERLLRKALDYYERFLEQRGDDISIQDELALTLFRVGEITEQIENPQNALLSYQRAREMQMQLVDNYPGNMKHLQALGDTINAIGHMQQRLENQDEALKAYRQAIVARRRLVNANPQDGENHRTLANSYMNIGLIQKAKGEFAEARSQFEKAQEIRLKHLNIGRDNPKMRRDLGMGYYNLANLVLGQTEPDISAAQQHLQNAVDVFEKLLEEDPSHLNNQNRLATSYRTLAYVTSMTEDQSEALKLYEKARQKMDVLARENPAVAEYRVDLAGLYMQLGQLQLLQQQPTKALTSYQQARDLLQPLVDSGTEDPRYSRDLAVTLREIGVWYAAGSQWPEARKNLISSREILAELVMKFPENQDYLAQQEETLYMLDELEKVTPKEK